MRILKFPLEDLQLIFFLFLMFSSSFLSILFLV